MAIGFETLSQITSHGFDAVIDVRSPSEYAEDHIPGAISLPVLSDAERATVGTIYVQESSFKARKIGAALVARNAARHLEGPLAELDGSWQPLVYCWRGGQRSGSFASILSQVGWRADVIEGGYRTYRRMVVRAMHDNPLPHELVLLDGNTGTAKTELLSLLMNNDIQVVDLEGISKHRGSIFGGMADSQPSQKSFESEIAVAFDRLDKDRPVVVEAESSKIGQCQIPPAVWAAMCKAPRIRVRASLDARAEYLTRAYADMSQDKAALKDTIAYLKRMQGTETVERWQGYVDANEMKLLATELMELHYDPRYLKSRSKIDAHVLDDFETGSLAPDALSLVAKKIAQRVSELR